MTISDTALKQITWLCRYEPDKEWAGIIYLKEEGNISDIDNFSLEVVYVHLMIVDNISTFSWDMDDSIIDLYEKHPELETMQMGLIHSHNKMGAYFSSTDEEELMENAGLYNYYTSLIVNNAQQFAAKIARHADGNTTMLMKATGGKFYKEKNL